MLAYSRPFATDESLYLKQLAIAVKKAPHLSLEYHLSLSRLIIALQQGDRLAHPRSSIYPYLHGEIYALGLKKLFSNLGHNLQTYNTHQNFLAWLHPIQQQYYAQATQEILTDTELVHCQPLTLDEL
ncbi:MAG: hypothetical protein SAJ12_12490 [Jaaginema sp. PMC 1079.18]|nr:hypothetical protein [Jaaginema sp. PMC 1080.18]MEC4851825.1 hypothetical protein [Jaaginema sp. PMC 1079.18]MEC4869109.1 hypothetical protein [Jaaginema sp. PMC 1078.18]